MLQILQKRPLPLQEHQLALQALQEGQLPLQAPLHTLKECQLPLPRKIAPTPSPTGTLALATVPTETTADPSTGPSGASSQEHCGKCKKLYPDSYRYKCKINKYHCSTDFCSSYCHQN